MTDSKQSKKSVISRFVLSNPDCTLLDMSKGLNMPTYICSDVINWLMMDGVLYVSGHTRGHNGSRINTYNYEDCAMKRRERSYEYMEDQFQSDVNALLAKWNDRIPKFIRVWFNKYRSVNNQKELF